MTQPEHRGPEVTSGGGAHDITGPEAAAHVAATDATATHHVADADHGAGHDEEPLGPIDWAAWRAAVLGIAIAAVMVALLYVAIR